jgi:chemotaxis protein MotB
MKVIRLLFMTAVALTLFNGCVSKKKFEEMQSSLQKQLSNLRADNAKLNERIHDLEKENAKLKADTTRLGRENRDLMRRLNEANKKITSLENDYSQLKSQSSKDLQDAIADYNRLKNELQANSERLKELERLLKERDELLEALRNKIMQALKDFENSGISVYEKDGKIYVSMSDKLLFDTGKWELRKDGKRALTQLADVLKQVTTVDVLVEGHTDSDPIRSSNDTPPKDNWELSVLRATEVTRTLTKENVDPKRITASGHGEFFPIASNADKEGKAKNRRTEIILVPDIKGILEKIKNKQ